MSGPEPAAVTLRAAWDDLLVGLGRARDAIDSPDLHAPPADDRGLAEGYRYLLGYLFSAVERAFFADPDFPYFRRAIQVTDKSTIDNADAMYLTTPIDGSRPYRIRGSVADHRHWRGAQPAATGPKAPQYVIFEAHTGYAGDSGELAELRPGTRTNTGKLDISTLEVDDDGTFEILLAPERPDGHTGNFIATRRDSKRTGRTHTAEHVSMRVLFHDWEREEPLRLHIAQLGKEGAHPPPLDAAAAAVRLRRVGEICDNQMRFWNEFYAVVLETYGDTNGDGERYMPLNDLNAPSPAGLATGGGQSTNVYSGGTYDLAPDEALLIEIDVPVPPAYSGFHLANLWGESHDYANHVSSLNGHQAERDADGRLRYVVAHRDPGVPNWLDTTGLAQGFMSLRWTYSSLPEDLPRVAVRKVPFAGIAQLLPAGTRSVSEHERREQVRIRQEHVQHRYRQY
jgi:hypothetical protein